MAARHSPFAEMRTIKKKKEMIYLCTLTDKFFISRKGAIVNLAVTTKKITF